VPSDYIPAEDSTDSAECWAELRTAVQRLEASMTEFQDAVTGLDDAFASVDSSVERTTPTALAANASQSESAAGD
jgi:hypothetical protein